MPPKSVNRIFSGAARWASYSGRKNSHCRNRNYLRFADRFPEDHDRPARRLSPDAVDRRGFIGRGLRALMAGDFLRSSDAPAVAAKAPDVAVLVQSLAAIFRSIRVFACAINNMRICIIKGIMTVVSMLRKSRIASIFNVIIWSGRSGVNYCDTRVLSGDNPQDLTVCFCELGQKTWPGFLAGWRATQRTASSCSARMGCLGPARWEY